MDFLLLHIRLSSLRSSIGQQDSHCVDYDASVWREIGQDANDVGEGGSEKGAFGGWLSDNKRSRSRWTRAFYSEKKIVFSVVSFYQELGAHRSRFIG
jgi:hypothetical protein